ncbi:MULTISPECIES: Imm26 family immunity protein [Paenibacillus]|uniref:Uncharacterized protein n=1 Tax=Paenibacillus brasilensis TaxID=128574 RepID=A0ABU0KSY6_9BACL|nr:MULTISPECIES: Imm26 family immunity protein [Paenibacillus]MDQ0492542.1 hypothetical protein [Paenibacillus brasilensis]
MVFKRIKHREGDIFVIPLHDGRFAVCQVICALYGRFKKALVQQYLAQYEDH